MKISILSSLISELESSKCKSDFEEMKKLTNLNQEEAAKLDTYFYYKISSLIESAKDITIDQDESELIRILPHLWIEYRMEWIRYNTQMQYQTVMQGKAQPLLAARGAALSYLLSLFEKHMSMEEIYWCTKLAADPMNLLRGRSVMAQRVVDMAYASGQVGQDIVENLIQLRETLSSEKISVQGLRGLDKVLHGVEELISSSTALGVSDLQESLEMVMSKNLSDSPIPLVISKLEADENTLIPAITIAGINDLFASWLTDLIKNSAESSIDERRGLGKTDHMNIGWRMKELSGGRILIEIENDGKGTSSLNDFSKFPTDWQIEQRVIPGSGSKIIVNFKGTQLANMIVFCIKNKNQQFRFALLSNVVIEIFGESRIQDYVVQGTMSCVSLKGSDGAFPLVNLSEILFGGDDISTGKNIFVRVSDSENRSLVIKAGDVEVIVRDSLKSGPKVLHFIQGYFMMNGSVVSVIDVAKLKEVIVGKHSFAAII